MVADLAGGDWSQTARVAAVALVADFAEKGRSLGVQLLTDLHSIFGDEDAMHTDTILGKLNAIEESPWGNLHGKELDARGLARRLRRYGAEPRDVRIGNDVRKGYRADDLADAWSRYVPMSS
jgi:Protein of unknown function (DUF3631)